MKKSIWMRLLLSAVMVFSVVIPTAALEENETSFFEWALYDPEYNLSHDVVIRALVELYK